MCYRSKLRIKHTGIVWAGRTANRSLCCLWCWRKLWLVIEGMHQHFLLNKFSGPEHNLASSTASFNFSSSGLAVRKQVIMFLHSPALVYWLAVVPWVTASVVMLGNLSGQVGPRVDDKGCQRALEPKSKWIRALCLSESRGWCDVAVVTCCCFKKSFTDRYTCTMLCLWSARYLLYCCGLLKVGGFSEVFDRSRSNVSLLYVFVQLFDHWNTFPSFSNG